MTTGDELLALAKRLEAATGREDPAWFDDLARAIHAVDPHAPVNGTCRDYCRSLDAAMTLVPAGRGWTIGFGVVPGAGDQPQLFAAIQDGPDMRVCFGYATPALALTAACLRAHASEAA